MKMAHALVVPVLVAVAFSGCTTETTDSSVKEPSGAGLPTPTPTATQARETGLVAPARVFGGDCANLVTDAEVRQLLGVSDVALYAWDFAPEMTAELYGGVHCQWNSVPVGLAGLDIAALPADAVSYDEPGTCPIQNEEFIGPACTLEKVVNGIRLSGALNTTAAS